MILFKTKTSTGDEKAIVVNHLKLNQLEHILAADAIYQRQLITMPIHRTLIEEYRKTKPFEDVNIAVAHVLVPNTLPMIVAMIFGGANITVTNCCPPTQDDFVIRFLNKIGCNVDLELKSANNYDYAIDCGGYFANSLPKIGSVEVTRSGIHKYNEIIDKSKNFNIQILSADDSKCKLIETFIGNPIAVLRGIEIFVNPNIDEYLKEKSVVIMGFGKIGSGLARLFRKYTGVLVLDINPRVLEKAEALGFETYLITDDTERNSSAVQNYQILMSATGFPNVITTNFIKSKLKFDLCLNIGAVDEFGDDYNEKEVFMSKDKPFNFNLNPPTDNLYIDPILAAHVDGLRYLIENKFSPGMHNLPESVDNRIIKLFEKFTDVDISDINLYFDY
ncbi:MAG: hypothetical protein GPJ54_12415 [Candidatus Heimdallarchaeota archaeon]|nr:hypothetical protein [Candidatus Heimdallarchaeota archaeon]